MELEIDDFWKEVEPIIGSMFINYDDSVGTIIGIAIDDFDMYYVYANENNKTHWVSICLPLPELGEKIDIKNDKKLKAHWPITIVFKYNDSENEIKEVVCFAREYVYEDTSNFVLESDYKNSEIDVVAVGKTLKEAIENWMITVKLDYPNYIWRNENEEPFNGEYN